MDPNTPAFQPQAQQSDRTSPPTLPNPTRPAGTSGTSPLITSPAMTAEQLTSAVQQLSFQSQQSQQQAAQLADMLKTISARMEEGFRHFEGRADRARERVEHVHQHLRQTSPQQELQPLPSGLKMPKLNMIDGKKEQELRDWFVKALQYLRAFRLDQADPRAVFYVSHHFTGALATWYQQHLTSLDDQELEGFASVCDLRDATLRQFTGRDPAEVARDNLRSKRQTGTVSDWAQFVRRQLVHLPKRDDADNLHTFKAGLSADIAKALAPQDPKSFADAVEMAIKIEASTRRIDSRQYRSGRTAGDGIKDKLQLANIEEDDDDFPCEDDDADSDVEEHDDNYDEEDLCNAQGDYVERSQREIARLKRERRCLRCGNKGHFARSCPKKPTNPNPKPNPKPLLGD